MNLTMEMIGGFILVFGFIAGLWWRIEAKIESAAKVKDELAAYKTHVAETYLPKSGLDKAVEQIMGAISDIKQTIDRVSDRIDRVAESKPGRSRSQ